MDQIGGHSWPGDEVASVDGREVETTGLKAAAWRKEASSALVADVRMALAMDWDLEGGWWMGGERVVEEDDSTGLVLAPRTRAGEVLGGWVIG